MGSHALVLSEKLSEVCGARVAAELRDRPDPGRLVPDFVHAGPALDGVPPLNLAVAQPRGSPAEISATLGTLASAGVDFLVTNSTMSRTVFGRVMEEADRLNKKVTVQGPLAYGYRYAARRGASSIETLSNLVEEASVDADAKKAMMYRTAVHRRDTTSNKAVGEQYLAHALHFVGELHRAGVPILAGTHTILPFVYPGLDLHHEVVHRLSLF